MSTQTVACSVSGSIVTDLQHFVGRAQLVDLRTRAPLEADADQEWRQHGHAHRQNQHRTQIDRQAAQGAVRAICDDDGVTLRWHKVLESDPIELVRGVQMEKRRGGSPRPKTRELYHTPSREPKSQVRLRESLAKTSTRADL